MTQAGLAHERDHLPTKELKVGQVIEEVHLHAVTACLVQPAEPLHDLRGCADQMYVAADHPLRTGVATPRRRVAALESAHEIVGGDRILVLEDGSVGRPRL